MEHWAEEGDDELGPADLVRPIPDDLSSPAFEDWYDPTELAAIEAAAPTDDQPVSRLSQWSRRTAIGAVLTGMALGLQEVFDPEEERPIVIEVDDDESLPDLPVQMILDPDSPRGSLCIIHRSHVPPPIV